MALQIDELIRNIVPKISKKLTSTEALFLDALQDRSSSRFRKIHMKTPLLESFLQ